MTHREDLEDEAPIEAALAIVAVVAQVLDEAVVAGEGGGEDDAGLVLERLGQGPADADPLAAGGLLVDLLQGDAGVAQGLVGGGDREAGRDVVRLLELGGNAPVVEVEGTRLAGEAQHLILGLDRDELALAGAGVLHEAHQAQVHEQLRALADVGDAVLAVQDAGEVLGVEDAGLAGQADAGAGRDHGGPGTRTGHDLGGHGILTSWGPRGTRSTGVGHGSGHLRSGRGLDRGGCRGTCGLERRVQQGLDAGHHRLHEGVRVVRLQAGLGGALYEVADRVGADGGRGGGQRGGQVGLGHGGTGGAHAHVVGRPVDERAQALVLVEAEVVLAGDPVGLAHDGEDLRLLDRVDAEIRLELEVEVQVLRVVAALAGDDAEDAVLDVGGGLGSLLDQRHVGGDRLGGGAAGLGGGEQVGNAVARLMTNRHARSQQSGQGVAEGPHAAALGVVRVVGAVGAALEDGHGKAGEGALGATLDEDAGAVLVHALQLGGPLDGRADLRAQGVDDVLDRVRAARVVLAGHVGRDRAARGLQAQAAQHVLQRVARRRDDGAVERVADGQAVDRDAAGAEALDRLVDRVGRTCDDGLAGAVLVRGDDVPGDLGQHFLDHVDVGGDAGHLARIIELDAGHLATARADGEQGLLERHDARGHGGAVLTQGVSRDHVGVDAVAGEQAQDRDVQRQGRRLAVLGAPEGELLLLGVLAVPEHDVVGDPLAQGGDQDAVGLVEGLLDQGVGLGEVEAHVEVLAALSGEQEGDLAVDRHILEVDAAGPEQVGVLLLGHDLDGAGQLGLLLLDGLAGGGDAEGIARVEGHAAAGGERLEAGDERRAVHGGRGPDPLRERALDDLDAGGELVGDLGGSGLRGGPGRGLRGGHGGRRLGDHLGLGRRKRGGLGQDLTGVLLEHHVEVGAAKAEGGHAGAAQAALGTGPGLGRGLHAQGHLVEIDALAGLLVAEARGEDAVVQGAGGLDDRGGACGRLQVTDHRLDGAHADGSVVPALPAADELGQGLQLDRVAHLGGRAVRLDEVDAGGVDGGLGVSALQGQALTDRVGGGDALPLAVRAGADTADDGVDGVLVADGLVQALEDEHTRALAHDEAVGAVVEGRAVIGRECPDLAELHVGRDVHRAVGAAGDGEVDVPVLQRLDRDLQGGEGARAGGVGREVRAAQVEGVGDAAGDDVRQLAGHGVLVDLGQTLLVGLLEVSEQLLALGRGQGLQHLAGRHLLADLGPAEAQGVVVLQLAAEAVAEDDAAAFTIEGPTVLVAAVGLQARVLEGVVDCMERYLLNRVDLAGHPRRDAEPLAVELEVPDEAADLGVGLVGDVGVGIEVQRRIPAIPRHLDDGGDALGDVLPEVAQVVGAGHQRAHADDGDGGGSGGGFVGGHGGLRGDRFGGCGWGSRNGGRGGRGRALGCTVGNAFGKRMGGEQRCAGGLEVRQAGDGATEGEGGGCTGQDRAIEPGGDLPQNGASNSLIAASNRAGGGEGAAAVDLVAGRGCGRGGDPTGKLVHGGVVGAQDPGEGAVALGESGGERDALVDQPEGLTEIAAGPQGGLQGEGILAGEQATEHRARGGICDAELADDAGLLVIRTLEHPGEGCGQAELGHTQNRASHAHAMGAQDGCDRGGVGADARVQDHLAGLGAGREELQAVPLAVEAARFTTTQPDPRISGGHRPGHDGLYPGRAVEHGGAILGEDDRAAARSRSARADPHPRAIGHGVRRVHRRVDDGHTAALEHESGEVGGVGGQEDVDAQVHAALRVRGEGRLAAQATGFTRHLTGESRLTGPSPDPPSAEPPGGAARLTGSIDDSELLQLQQLLPDLEHGCIETFREGLGFRTLQLRQQVHEALGEGLGRIVSGLDRRGLGGGLCRSRLVGRAPALDLALHPGLEPAPAAGGAHARVLDRIAEGKLQRRTRAGGI